MSKIPTLHWLFCSIVLTMIIASLFIPRWTNITNSSLIPLPAIRTGFLNYSLDVEHFKKPSRKPKNFRRSSQKPKHSKKPTKKTVPEFQWKSVRKASVYGDGSCGDHNRARLIQILKRWHDIATKHNITYMLTYGSLLGAWRNGEKMPWDTDLDIYTDASDNAKLDAIKDDRGFSTYSNDFHLALDVDWRIPSVSKRRRVRCDGKVLMSKKYWKTDSCTFTGPLGRLIKGYEVYLDIWDVERVNGKVFDRYGKGSYYPESEIFPLQKCSYMGLEVFCPRNPKPIFDAFYGKDKDLTNKWVCKRGKWKGSY